MFLYGILFLPDSRPQTPDPFFPIHQSLITSHQTPLFTREAILACASRLAKAKPLLAAGCSSCQKWSPYFLVSSRSALIRDLVPRYPRPAERNWAPKATGIAKRYWRRRSFYWRQDVLPAKKGVPIFWCHPVVILYGILFLPDSRPQTPDQFFPIHQSLITSHQTPLFTREAILACVSRLAVGCSSHKNVS